MRLLWFDCAMRLLERAVPIVAMVGIIAAMLYRHGWPVMLGVTLLDPSLPAMLSRRETCKQGGFGLSTLKLLLATSQIRQIRVGKKSLIAKVELERFLSGLISKSVVEAD